VYSAPGYYSYATIFNDIDNINANPTASFSGLSISFTADNWVDAIAINGVIYDGFTSSRNEFSFGQYESLFIPSDGNISWHAWGWNTVEFIVYSTGGLTAMALR